MSSKLMKRAVIAAKQEATPGTAESLTTAEGACLTLNMGGWVSDPAWGAPCMRTADAVLATLCIRDPAPIVVVE